MPTTRPILNQEEYELLRSHLRKHKVYPFSYRIKKTISVAGGFATADGSASFHYFTLKFTPTTDTGIISLASNLVITPSTTFGLFGIHLSYNDTLTLADQSDLTAPVNEGTTAYNLMVNGGAINDFQVFFPLNFYVESRKSVYLHVYADDTTIAAASSVMTGQIVLGTMPLTN